MSIPRDRFITAENRNWDEEIIKYCSDEYAYTLDEIIEHLGVKENGPAVRFGIGILVAGLVFQNELIMKIVEGEPFYRAHGRI